MILVLKKGVKENQIGEVLEIIKKLNLSGHVSRGEECIVIGIVGANIPAELQGRFEGLPFVENVVRISKPYKLASREFKGTDTKIDLKDLSIGGKELAVMAGPCSVEGGEQHYQAAVGGQKAGGA